MLKKAKAVPISLCQINGRNVPISNIIIPLGSPAKGCAF